MEDLVLTRTFAAPRDLVFACWVEQVHLDAWQGAPQGFTVREHEADIRPGGHFKLCMRSREGEEHWLQGTYVRVERPHVLEFTHSWIDQEGKPAPETLVTVTLTDVLGATELTLRQSGFISEGSREGHRAGWESTLQRLTNYINETRTGRS